MRERERERESERERERERERMHRKCQIVMLLLCSIISVNISGFLATIARCAPGGLCNPVGTGGRVGLVRG